MIKLIFFAIVFVAIIVTLIGVLLYFFTIAFVKMKNGNLEDLNHPENDILEPYRDTVQSGIDYIYNTPHKWVYTKSFDGLYLAARYYNNNSDKTMLLFHGYRSAAARDFSCAVKMYADMGFNVLLCDQRSHGKSEGRLITFGVKESQDVISWVDFINKEYPAKSIALGGLSMGATTVLLACGLELPQNVKCVVADCGFTSPADIIKIVARKNFKINAEFFLPLLDICCKIFGKFSIIGVSTPQALKKSNLPVLLIHGKSDGLVPYEMSKSGYDVIPDRAEIVLIDGADHGLAFLKDTKTVYFNLENFLNKNVN